MSFLEKRTKNIGTREKSLPSAKLGCARCKTQASLVFTRWHKSSQAPFVHAAYCVPSIGHLLVSPGYRLFSGCCGSHCVRHFFKKYNCRTTFGRASHSGLKTSGLALDFSTVPFRRWRGITFAKGYSANFTRTMVISKRNRHR